MKEITDIKLMEVSLMPDGAHEIGFTCGPRFEMIDRVNSSFDVLRAAAEQLRAANIKPTYIAYFASKAEMMVRRLRRKFAIR